MLNLGSLAFQLQRGSKTPLFVQLCDQIRQRIVSGRLARDLRLPASRNLAAELGLSRSTVVTAYEQLVAEGYIEGRPGSGYFVCRLGESDSPQARGKSPANSRENEKIGTPPAFSHPGYPDHRLFPYRPWARSIARSARLTPTALIRSTSPFGSESLRKSIAQYLSDWRGLGVQPEQVLITAGSIDALETCIRTLATGGDSVAMENPGYQPLKNIIVNQGMQIEWLRVGPRGAELPVSDPRKTTAKLAVLTPSHQFPLGGAMPPDRRLEFQQWAGETGAWIIEDDYDSEFRYAGRPIPAMASMDNSGRTIYVGTFSKVFSVSLRLGYLIMPVQLISEFATTLARFGIKAALPCQPALADFIDNGDFYRHIRRVRRIYAERRKTLLEQVQARLSEHVTHEDHHAGMHIATRLICNLDDQGIAALAAERGAPVSPLSSHYGSGAAEKGLLLGFCPYTEAEIETNIATLAGIIESMTKP